MGRDLFTLSENSDVELLELDLGGDKATYLIQFQALAPKILQAEVTIRV
jgi:hypothetical protein